jgi:phosphohistidine phosphatase SixA
MRANGYQPALVLCSTAVRAKQTLELIVPKLEDEPETRFDRALYLAEWPRLMTKYKMSRPARHRCCWWDTIPAWSSWRLRSALQSQSGSERERRKSWRHKFPTAALAVLDFDIADGVKCGRAQAAVRFCPAQGTAQRCGRMNGSREGAGRTALVTGASAGIGEALAREFAAHGFNLVLTARRTERLIALSDELRRACAVETLVMPGDLAQPDTCAKLVASLTTPASPSTRWSTTPATGVPGLYRETSWEAQRDFIQVLVTAPCELTHRLCRA